MAAILTLVLTGVMRAGVQDGPAWSTLVTAHGLLMMVFTLMPALCGGLGLWLLPVQIGARGLAFPRMALASWALHVVSLLLAAAAMATFSATTGLAALAVAGLSALLIAINTITTFLNMRAPDVSLGSAPMFAWSLAISGGLTLMAVPTVAGAALVLALQGPGDLSQSIPFFTHPLVFILILPAFGIITEIVATFATRGLAGRAIILASMGILAGFGVTLWVQELYAHGTRVQDGGFFGLAAAALIPPALVIITMWAASLAQGVRQVSAPLVWAAGFVLLMLGVCVFSIESDGMARFHYALGLGAVFGAFGGFYFWLPKIAHRRLPDGLGALHAGLMFIGVQLSFLPPIFGWPEGVELAGAALSGASFALFLGMTVWAVRYGQREEAPWGALSGREWQETDLAVSA